MTDAWHQTYRGVAFRALDPSPDDVDILDIAHSLSHTCRYKGHSARFYCPTPDQRVLTADLRWVPAGDLAVGDDLFGFDEHPRELGSAGVRRRRFRHAVVTAAQPVRRETYELEMEDGATVRCSAEHPWLVATKVSRNQTWETTENIAKAIEEGRGRYMHRFFSPWRTADFRDAGWLAGVFDGEGHLSLERKGVQLAAAQLPGLVLDRMQETARSIGFSTRMSAVGDGRVQSMSVLGGWREAARFLGTIRPHRLLAKALAGLLGGQLDKQMDGIGAPSRIVGARSLGADWVAGLETSTHTYFCEGFGAHNSVAEHSVYVSRIVPSLEALLHDAAEAYSPFGDVPRPYKHLFPFVVEVEDRLEQAIAEHFGLEWPWPVGVKVADCMLLADEKAALMRPGHDWQLPYPGAGTAIACWSPRRAEYEFLKRFRELEG